MNFIGLGHISFIDSDWMASLSFLLSFTANSPDTRTATHCWFKNVCVFRLHHKKKRERKKNCSQTMQKAFNAICSGKTAVWHIYSMKRQKQTVLNKDREGKRDRKSAVQDFTWIMHGSEDMHDCSSQCSFWWSKMTLPLLPLLSEDSAVWQNSKQLIRAHGPREGHLMGQDLI